MLCFIGYLTIIYHGIFHIITLKSYIPVTVYEVFECDILTVVINDITKKGIHLFYS